MKLPFKHFPPSSTLTRCCFFITTPQKVKILIINQKKVHFFVKFFEILTGFSSRSAIEAHRLMLGIIKALNASALPTHSRSSYLPSVERLFSWGPPKITTFAAKLKNQAKLWTTTIKS